LTKERTPRSKHIVCRHVQWRGSLVADERDSLLEFFKL